MMERRISFLFYFGIVVLIGILGFVLATAPHWNSGADINYSIDEDTTYYHNLSANITGYNNDVSFAFDSESNITWTNATGTYNITQTVISSWIRILNSAIGNLSVNATFDNETGYFIIPIQATNTSDGLFEGANFKLIINATNDAPNFTNINNTYTFSALNHLYEFLNASDEESHYPLTFNITFNTTYCTHAAWSGYNDNESCSLYDFGFNLTHLNNVSALINMTPNSTHVGVYYANVSVIDAGNLSLCPHIYCDNATYQQNKTTYYSQIVTFNIESSLSINTTNCQNMTFNESQEGTCNITIRTKEVSDDLNISTYAILRNYYSGQSGVSNTSWFYVNESETSSNFQYNVTINVTPGKTEIGNWTINFTVEDDNGDTATEQIYVYVNRTIPDTPDLASISNLNTSINLQTVINLTVYDDDFLISDKNSSYGGFNETLIFNRTILNQSDLSPSTLSDFNITVLYMPVSGTNRTTAEIRFTPTSSDVGNYTINISVNDSEGRIDYELFNLSIINNSYPYWLSPLNTTFVIYENNNTYLNLSQNVSDADGDVLTFSYVNDTLFSSFNLNSTTGIINFTAIDEDVGQHIVNITISDGYLTNKTSFNFTILNINDSLSILYIDGTNTVPAFPAHITNGSFVNATEDNYTTFTLYVEDDDYKIPSGQKSFYDENLTVNLTILNSTGQNVSLFSFVKDADWPIPPYTPNQTKYDANFTPKKIDVGNYNITINVTDKNKFSSDFFVFYLNILAINHNPELSNLTNKTSAINRSFYYDLNVTDVEDGNDTSGALNTNFTFNYTFLNDGINISFLNLTNFNSTTGIINVTFNPTQDGKYHINFSVNDSSSRIDYQDIWIYVYGLPTLVFPTAGSVFNLAENSTSVLNFTINHSVADNLTYNFYIDSIIYNGSFNYEGLVLKNTTNYYGNGTSYNWSFIPNMTDETYGLYKNLTIIVYPNNSNLENATYLNASFNFKLNISHANSSVSFVDNIDDQSNTYGTSITINLYSHFSDDDHDDAYYNENLTFTPSINTSSITCTVPLGILTCSASSAVAGRVNITASDGPSSAISNSFTITFTEPSSSSSSSTSGGGGGTTTIPVSLKIIMPNPVSAYQKDRIVLPIILQNTGSQALYDITLNGSVAKNGTLSNDIVMNFSDNHFSGLDVGQKEKVTLTLNINTDEVGMFEITINASVKNPNYKDWGKLYLTIKEGENVEEKILFTEEFIVQNPECLELIELVDEAKEYLKEGNSEMALKKAEEALQACKLAISQPSKQRFKQIVENKLYRYLVIATIAALFLGVAFYSYKRMKLRRKKGPLIQESIKNKKYLEYKYKPF